MDDLGVPLFQETTILVTLGCVCCPASIMTTCTSVVRHEMSQMSQLSQPVDGSRLFRSTQTMIYMDQIWIMLVISRFFVQTILAMSILSILRNVDSLENVEQDEVVDPAMRQRAHDLPCPDKKNTHCYSLYTPLPHGKIYVKINPYSLDLLAFETT